MSNFFLDGTRIKVLALLFSAAAMSVALLALIGVEMDIAWLRSPSPSVAEIRPITAIAQFSAGFALFVLTLDVSQKLKIFLRFATGIGVTALGLYVVASYVGGFPTFTDFLLVPDGFRMAGSAGNRMPPQTALLFCMVGISIMTVGAKGLVGQLGSITGFTTVVTTYAVCLGLLFNSTQFFGISNVNTVAIYAAVGFVTLAASIIFSDKRSNILYLIKSDSLGGHTARRLLPTVIIVPTIIGWLRVMGQERGFYDTGFGTTISTFLLVLLMFSIVAFYSKAVHQADQKRIDVEAELVQNEKRYRDLFQYSEGMICTHLLDGTLRSVNPAVTRSLGYIPDELIGRNLVDFLPEKNKVGFSAFIRTIDNSGISNGLLPLVAKNGSVIIWRYNSILVTEDDGTQYVIGQAQDVTELISVQKQLKSLSDKDELTGLYNRRGFMTLAEQQIKLETHANTRRGLTLLFADLDGLKKINDLYGHRAGSDAIIHFGNILRTALRSADLIARWGGDEFVILTIGAKDENVQAVIERIRAGIDEHNLTSFKPYELACSIGLSTLPFDGSASLETIIAEADKARYAEKRRRKADRESIDAAHQNFIPVAVSALHDTLTGL